MRIYSNPDTLAKIRSNAKYAANRDGYNQAIIKEVSGTYSFATITSYGLTVPLFDGEQIVEIVKPTF